MRTQQSLEAGDRVHNHGQRFSIIIPAYNEASSIFASVQETLRAMAGVDCEIIVVDDGSTDSTYQEVRRAAQSLSSRRSAVRSQDVADSIRRPADMSAILGGDLRGLSKVRSPAVVHVVRYDANQGKGHALKYGFAHTTGELVAFLDADLDLHPRQIWTLYEVMQQTGADAVIGSKQHPESNLDYPWQRRFVSWSYFALVHLLFGLPIHDTQTGLKLFRREVLDRVFPRMRIRRFAHDLELLVGAHRFGYRIAEAPVTLNFGQAKMGRLALARASFNVWLDTLRVFYWASFWKWLSPGLSTKVWLAAFIVGVFFASFGLAHWLITLPVPPPLGPLMRVLALHFLDKRVRDVVLFGVGLVLIAAAAVELNKHVLAAFAQADQGDLAGIMRSNAQSPRSEVETEFRSLSP